jgi:hypothetical protein
VTKQQGQELAQKFNAPFLEVPHPPPFPPLHWPTAGPMGHRRVRR